MKTKFIAIFAVLAMVFVGAAVIAEDNASDAADFAENSAIDAYARSTGVSHAIHYNTTGGMLTIVLSDTDYATLNTPDIAVQVVVTNAAVAPATDPTVITTVYDPVSKAKEIHLNIGALGTTSTVVKVAVHGSAFTSGTINFTMGAITTASFNLDDGTQTGTPANISDNKPTSLVRNLVPAYTNTNYTMIGWSTSESGDVVLDNGATLESILMNAANVESVYTLYAIWSNQSFTVAFEFNKPTFIGGTRYVNTADAAGTADTEAVAAVTAVSDSSGTTTGSLTMTVAGENYVLSETYHLQGYTFAGWYTKQVGGERITLSSATTDPVKTSIQTAFGNANLAKGGTYTIYAHWTAVEYTVTYDATKLAIGFTIGDSPTANWNIQTIAYDKSAALKTISQLDTAAGGSKLTPKAGYIFSHWELSTDSSVDYEAGAMVSNLNAAWTTATVTLYPVFDYQVTVTGLIKGLDFQPQDRTVPGYEMLVDGDLTGTTNAKYKFKVAFDNLLISVSDITVNTVSIKSGTPAALPTYDDGGITYEITGISAPQAIAITAAAEYFSVTVNGDADGEVALSGGYEGVTINWTKVVPKSKEGLLTIASSAVGTSSYVYDVTITDTTNFEKVKVSNNVYKIKQKGTDAMTLAITVSAAAATHDKVENMTFSMDSISTTAATAYLRANSYEVPAGAIKVAGTAYKTEGGVTTYTALPYNSYTSKGVTAAGVHAGVTTDVKEPGTGYEEYQITVASPNGYTLYAAKMTFTPTGGSAISTVYAI